MISVTGTYNGTATFSDQMGIKTATGLDAFVWKMSAAGQQYYMTTFAFFTGGGDQE